jgi:hypothetical protein
LCPVLINYLTTVAFLVLLRFKVLDKTTIDKIGHEEVGRKWRSMSDEEKFSTIQVAVSDPLGYQERLSATNFDSFLLVLSYFVGGDKVQTMLLKKQLHVQLKILTFNECISDQIHSIHKTALGIGAPVDNLRAQFWRVYFACENASIGEFETNVDVLALDKPMFELLSYHRLVKKLGWDGEEEIILGRMKELVRRQLQVVTSWQHQWSFDAWYKSVTLFLRQVFSPRTRTIIRQA